MNCIPLGRVRKEDALLCGNKGAQLGELAFAGLPVPDGFIVSTEVYANFLKESGLGEQIQDILQSIDPVLHPDMSFIAEEIKGWSLQYHINEQVREEINTSMKNLRVPYVAVRSSAVVAENENVMFTGRLATTMNVKCDNLIENIERVWMSLYSSRALQYLFRKQLIEQHVLVGIIVQAMVDAQVSGVMYCASTSSGKPSRLVVEAGWGLGETMVSGIVTPDRYVIDCEIGEIAETSIGKQMKEYVREGDRLRFSDIPEPRICAKKLTNEQLLYLTNLYQKALDHCGFPQKIEWAYADGQFYILQGKTMIYEPE